MRHVIARVSATVAVAAAALVAAVPAGAGPSERVTVSLACDRGVSATATVAFVGPNGGATPLMHCGDDAAKQIRVVVDVPAAVLEIDVTWGDTAGETVACPDTRLSVPARVDCPEAGKGARLVVR